MFNGSGNRFLRTGKKLFNVDYSYVDSFPECCGFTVYADWAATEVDIGEEDDVGDGRWWIGGEFTLTEKSWKAAYKKATPLRNALREFVHSHRTGCSFLLADALGGNLDKYVLAPSKRDKRYVFPDFTATLTRSVVDNVTHGRRNKVVLVTVMLHRRKRKTAAKAATKKASR